MPFAIEFAAARVTMMNPDELLAGLNDRFQLLSGGRRRSRQRTLEATLDTCDRNAKCPQIRHMDESHAPDTIRRTASIWLPPRVVVSARLPR